MRVQNVNHDMVRSRGSTSPTSRRWLLRITFAVLATMLLWPMPQPKGGWGLLWWNWCHVPVFALMGWMVLHELQRTMRSWAAALPLTMAILALIALGTEGLQYWTGRTAEWNDVGSDLLGGCAGISAAIAAPLWRGGRFLSCAAMALACGLLIFSAMPLLARAAATVRSAHAFPMLEDFEHAGNLVFWSLERNGVPERLDLIENRWSHTGHCLTIHVTAEGLTSLHFDAKGRNWSDASRLSFDYQLDTTRSLLLGVRIDPADTSQHPMRLEAYLEPGSHHADIDLSARGAKSPLGPVKQLVLFVMDSGADAKLSFDNIKLE